MGEFTFSADAALPADWRAGSFLGRIDRGDGPSPALIRGGRLYDMARVGPTTVDLIEARAFEGGEDLGPLETLPLGAGPSAGLRLLSPIDLQCIKAAGVTFAVSTLERVIEERARGDSAAAAGIRDRLEGLIGSGLRSVVPGSEAAAALKDALIREGMWSQYLEVAIGPDAEIFTKAPILASVGWGEEIGVRSDSTWNNPEPEVVLVADSAGAAVGAMLGNDVNLRDFEGRSALLLGKAKDNNASCAVGPFIRLFDATFAMDDVRSMEIDLTVEGEDGYRLTGVNSMRAISRDPETLLRHAMSEHQYPDGFVLFLGTLFAPTQDRDEPGRGFTHKAGDRVTIAAARLGVLANRVATSKDAAPWTFGVRALMRNLAARDLLTV